MTTYTPGTFIVVRSPGIQGWLVRLGQRIARRDVIRVRRAAGLTHDVWANHAELILTPDGDTLDMEPGGARLGHVTHHSHVRLWDGKGASTEALAAAAVIGRKLLDDRTAYGWIDFQYAALRFFGCDWPWFTRIAASARAVDCSASVDHCLTMAGLKVFDDGRMPAAVTPVDLQWLIDDGAEIPYRADGGS